ncbi:MAG: ribbon-helix-helix protein, CopG family [Planctomycetes bacterium]|nr:ribbon-helix-helix protein, CopG family [Planctomycetota bacterium]
MPGYSISIDSQVMERFEELSRKHEMNRSQALERLMKAAIKQEEAQQKEAKDAGGEPKASGPKADRNGEGTNKPEKGTEGKGGHSKGSES